MSRILTAAVLIPAVTYVTLWGHPYLFLAVLAAVALLCFREYGSLVAAHGIDPPGPAGYGAGLALLAAPEHGLLWATGVALLALSLAMRSADLKRSLPRAAALAFGVLYVFGTWKTAAWLRAESPHWLFFALALSWVGDTAAFLAGKAFGRHKLAPRLSPAKSWEGSAASLAVCMVFAWLYFGWLMPEVQPWLRVVLGLAGSLAGQLGDLAESAMKRGAGIKDSGNLLPGHGGWLDRTDSTLFTLPIVWTLVLLMKSR